MATKASFPSPFHPLNRADIVITIVTTPLESIKNFKYINLVLLAHGYLPLSYKERISLKPCDALTFTT